MTHTTELYFECHVTIEPVFGKRLEEFVTLCKGRRFHVAKLLMQKRESETPERNSKDSFCTGRSTDYQDIHGRMKSLIDDLQNAGFQVWRYKIENTLIDSEYGDQSVIL